MFFKRLMVAILALAVALSSWTSAAWAQVEYSAGTVSVSSGGSLDGAHSATPPPGAINAAQAEAAVTQCFTPPEGATVNADFSASFLPSQKQIWNLNWIVLSPSLSGGPAGNMWASVDAITGRILNYSRYSSPGISSQGSPAVNYSYQEALAKARQVMAELAPEAVGQVKLETGPNSPGHYAYPTNNDYSFNFIRLANGLPVWESGQPQGINIGVNARTGEVDRYNYNWLTGVSFPSPKPELDVTKATYDWWNTGGLELQYNYILPVSPASAFGGSNKVRLAYVLKDGGLNVDAGSGSIIDNFGTPYQAAASAAIPAPTVPLRSLPPGGLTSNTAVLSWAQQILPIPDSYKIANVGQHQMPGPTGQTIKQWNLSWSKNGQGMEPDFISANFMADSGQLMSYFCNSFVQSASKAGAAVANTPAFSRQQALQKAADFLAGTAGINLSTGYRLETTPAYQDLTVLQNSYDFSFTPTPNGIPFKMGSLSVRVSSATGQLLSFSQFPDQFFSPGGLPSPQGIMGMDQARDIFNKDITLQLGYLIPAPAKTSDSQPSASPSPVLVYGVPGRFTGAVIDAVTGEVTDREGTNLLLGSGPPADVAGSWAADNIELALQRHLMSVDNQGLFHPQGTVTRGEAVHMLLQAVNGIGFQVLPSESPMDFSDVPTGSPNYGVVEAAYHMGMVTKADKFHPDDPVTRQDFTVMAVRTLKYDAIGRMTLRIPLPYLDADLVSPVEANYVALAAGLGIFGSGGDFRPTDPLTRAEAATVLVRMPSPR